PNVPWLNAEWLNAEMLLLELRHLCKVEVAHLHGWNHHIERLFAAGADRCSHFFDVREHMNQAFVEAKIAHAVAQLSVFHIKRSIAGHAGEDLFIGINLADVPETRDQEAAFR